MRGWLVGAVALSVGAAPALAQEDGKSNGSPKVTLWRDIYLGEPKADIDARYPEFKADAKGKQKRLAFHRADETFIKEKVVLRRDHNGEPLCEKRQVEVKYDAQMKANKVMLGFFQDCEFSMLVETMVAKYGTDATTIDGAKWYSSYKQAALDNGLTLVPSAAIWDVGDLRITMTSPDILRMMYITYEPLKFDTIDKNAF